MKSFLAWFREEGKNIASDLDSIFRAKMHDESKAGKVFVQIDDSLVELLMVLEDKETVVGIEGWVEEEGRSFSSCILA